MSEPTIKIRGLVKTFSPFQLGPLDLNVPKGAIYGLIGPNAAGKTTTIDLIMGLLAENAGSIHVFGLNRREHEAEIKGRIGYVAPTLNYEAWGVPKRLVHFLRGFYPDWDMDYCQRLFEKFGIGWKDPIKKMSFGTKTKLAVAMALAHRPELLLLDEPVIGVDAVVKEQIFSELLEAVRDEDRTVLISSHGLSDIERFADHVGIIKNGQMLLEGPTNEIVERHRMVQFVPADVSSLPSDFDGYIVQSRDNNKCRALVDIDRVPLDRLQSLGAKEIADSPVTLEELFVALVKEN